MDDTSWPLLRISYWPSADAEKQIGFDMKASVPSEGGDAWVREHYPQVMEALRWIVERVRTTEPTP